MINNIQSDIHSNYGDDQGSVQGTNNEALTMEVDALRSQLSQFSHSVSFERDRVEVLDLQLRKEVNYYHYSL